MNSFVEMIGKIGIFMIAGQAVIHFAPEQKYAKYMKLIVGLIILLQFLSPIYKLIGGSEEEWNAQMSKMAEEFNEGVFISEFSESEWNENYINENIIAGMEKEIKSKLNNEISGEKYAVIKVSTDISTYDVTDNVYKNNYGSNDINNIYNNTSYEKYKLNNLHVAVRLYDDYENYEYTSPNSDNEDDNGDSNVVNVEKITIQKIGIDEDNVLADKSNRISEQMISNKQELSDRLKERFCKVLGIEEEYMEVSIYGTVE